MKVLVVSNCATRAYVEFFHKCFPKWETRGALSSQVDEWVENENTDFLSYVESTDIFVGLIKNKSLSSVMPENSLKVFIPPFVFFGYFPDSIFLHGITSPLERGVIHSRIAASAYIAGKSEQDAAKLFNKAHFSELGYLNELQCSKEKLLSVFNTHNIDLGERFEAWSSDGNFLYTVNHPQAVVFFDIAFVAMRNHYPELLSHVSVERVRETVDDYMGKGLVWPVYSAISDFQGLPSTNESWRTSDVHLTGTYLDLQEFIHRSYERYGLLTEFSESCIKQLGGMNEILRFAGVDSSERVGEKQVA